MPEPVLPLHAALLVSLLNTYDLEPGTDDIATPEKLQDWLTEWLLLPTDEPPGSRDVIRIQELRAALREALRAHPGVRELPPEVNAAVADVPLRMRFDTTGRPTVVPQRSRGMEYAIGEIVAAVVTATAEGDWDRLKLCGELTCEWVFYDRSKNQSRQWCSMQVCGNRTKTRSYRRRHRTIG